MYDWVRRHNHLQTWHDGKLNYFIQAVTGRKFRRIECGSKTCFKLKISNGCQGRRGDTVGRPGFASGSTIPVCARKGRGATAMNTSNAIKMNCNYPPWRTAGSLIFLHRHLISTMMAKLFGEGFLSTEILES